MEICFPPALQDKSTTFLQTNKHYDIIIHIQEYHRLIL